MSAQQSQPDDNMVPGQTYTFKLSLGNLITRPSAATITQDLNSNAPSFVSNSLQVTIEDNTGTVHWLTNIYDVQFSYNGDGTDVISDVANSLIAAIKSGSNDDFTFTGAWADTAASVGGSGSISDTLNNAIGTVNDSIKNLAGGLSKTTADTAQTLLTPIEIMVAIAVGLVVLLIFTSGKAGGVAAGPTGVKVGGR